MFHSAERIAIAALDRRKKEQDWLRIARGLSRLRGFWWLDSALADGRLGRISFAGAEPYLVMRARLSAQAEAGGASGPGAGHEQGAERSDERVALAEIGLEVIRAVRPAFPIGSDRLEADPFECARALLPRADSIVYSAANPGRSAVRAAGPGWHEVAGLAAGLDLPFLGGAIGYFGYELAAATLPRTRLEGEDELGLPDLCLCFVDGVLAYVHAEERLFAIGMGFGDGRVGRDAGARPVAVARSRRVAEAWLARVERILAEGPSPVGRADVESIPSESFASKDVAFESTADAAAYAKAVDAVLQQIGAGNVYQANFAQRLRIDAAPDPFRLYEALRRHNPAPFGAYLDLPEASILSSSPERFLRLDETRVVESRPIKGTRPRGEDEAEDLRLAAELAQSAKDRAENLMIVDLVRNDLGRVCAPGSIEVPALMEIEAYAAVFQMVSTVTGRLAGGRDALDLLRATFPPGSMTGAPKRAAVELLDRLERVRRGVYRPARSATSTFAVGSISRS